MLRIIALGVCLVLTVEARSEPRYLPPYRGPKPPPKGNDNTNQYQDNNVGYPPGQEGYYQEGYQQIQYRRVDRCNSDKDCKGGLICLNFWCIPIQCRKDKDCGNPRLACSRGRCINRKRKCQSDKQCGKGYICQNNFCTFEQCWRDQDCGSGNRCERGRCLNKPRCQEDGQCGRGRICEDTFCVPRQCNKNADCLEQDTCFRGRCLADCTPCFYRDPKSRSNECIYKCQMANEYCDEGKCVCNFGYYRNPKQQCEIRPPPPPPKEYYQQQGPNDYQKPPYQPGSSYPPKKPVKRECYDGQC